MVESFDPGMGMQMDYGIDMVQMWEQSPILALEMLGGSEVFINMEEIREDGSATNLEEVWMAMREHLLKHRFVVAALQGGSNNGKGGTQMGIGNISKDEYFLAKAGEVGIKQIDDYSIPYAHCVPAAQRIGLVPTNRNPATYDWDDQRQISQLQFRFVKNPIPAGITNAQELEDYLKRQNRAILMRVEGSTSLTFPIFPYQIPVAVDQQYGTRDLGQSTIANLALDPVTGPNLWVFSLLRNPNLRNQKVDSNKFRQLIFSPNPDPLELFGGPIQVVVPDPSGEKVPVLELPEIEQLQVIDLLRLSMAPLTAIKLFDQEFDRLLDQLYKAGLIAAPTETAYFRQIWEPRLQLPSERFKLLYNPEFKGGEEERKNTYDLSYHASSVVLRKECPQLLPEPLRSRFYPTTA